MDFWEKNAERGEEFIWVRVKEFEFIYYSSFVTKETYFDERVRECREREKSRDGRELNLLGKLKNRVAEKWVWFVCFVLKGRV